MTKTPEQMAEEYAEFGLQGVPDSIRKQQLMAKDRMAFLAGYQAAQQWISVKERLPKVLESILVLYAPTNEAKNDYRMECWNWPETDVYETKFITHWMPLPAAPKEEV